MRKKIKEKKEAESLSSFWDTLSEIEIKAILRAADNVVLLAGKNMLEMVLKGSKDKRLLALSLDKTPFYGFYKNLTMTEISQKIDWMFNNEYLSLQRNGRFHHLVFCERGWEIEKDTYSNELLVNLKKLIGTGNYEYVYNLKNNNQETISLLLDKIRNTGNQGFIPILEAWAAADFKQVTKKIYGVIDTLRNITFTSLTY